MARWAHHIEGAEPVHVWPLDDVVEHDTDGDECVCGPSTEPVPRADGSMGWLVTHHSLDGREGLEPGARPDRPLAP